MNANEELKELVFEVNDFLSEYIKIHNIISGQSESFISVIKNLFGKGIPMLTLLDYAKNLLPIYELINSNMNAFRSKSYLNLSENEKYYFSLLSNYLNALHKTVLCLVEKQILLAEQSQLNKKISYSEINKKGKEYNMLIEKYLLIGRELNDNNRLIF